ATACGTKDTASATNEEGNSVKKIYVAHTQTYVPFDYVNEKGESDGYEVQVLKEVDKLLEEYEFEFVPTTDDDLLIGVETGKYNVGVKGAWYTEERSKKYKYPENYIGASSIGLVIRVEDSDKITDMQSFAKENGKLVPIGPQNAQYTIVAQYNSENPDNQILLEASDAFEASDAYQWVLEGRYDGYFNIKTSYEANVVSETGVYNDFVDKFKYIPYKAIPTYPLFNIEDTQLATAYDAAIVELRENGTLLNLSQEYFGENIFDYVAE
ncbi:MAG: transporter substrate-binding domain-containing protein, partial [Anaerotignaceae bacterium]